MVRLVAIDSKLVIAKNIRGCYLILFFSKLLIVIASVNNVILHLNVCFACILSVFYIVNKLSGEIARWYKPDVTLLLPKMITWFVQHICCSMILSK